MLKFLVFLLYLAVVTRAELTDDCLACMCYVSSDGCQMPDPPCRQESWGVVCSPWGFTQPYWEDAGKLGDDFETCGGDWDCSEATVRSYLDRYVTDDSATCETYARMHFGGPYGADGEGARDYWYEVQNCLEDDLLTLPPE